MNPYIRLLATLYLVVAVVQATTNDDPHVEQTTRHRNLKGSSSSSRSSKRSNIFRSNGSSKSSKDSCSDDTSDDALMDVEGIRSILADFVGDLQGADLQHAYHADASSQTELWNTCTIVEQCLDPDNMLDMGLPNRSYLIWQALAKTMSQESYNMLVLQQFSNLLLGEMQDWATSCPGECRQLTDPNGQLQTGLDDGGNAHVTIGTDYDQCAQLRKEGRFTYWWCYDPPRLINHADINVTSGKYWLGNIFQEPVIHARNAHYDYVAIYGDLSSDTQGPFGFRFSGHHLDLNFQFENGKLVNDLPVFLGHNPLIVPSVPPPVTRQPNETFDPHTQGPSWLMWENNAKVPHFPESVNLVLDCANQLLKIPGSYVPMNNFVSVPRLGGFELNNNKTIDDFDYVDLSTISEANFAKFWSILDYTLKFARGRRSTKKERNVFRREGKAIWTTTEPIEQGLPLTVDQILGKRHFFYLRIETEEWLFFCMVNQLFTLVSEEQASNHLHSIIVEKKYLTCDHSLC